VSQGDDELYYDRVIEEIRTYGVREGLWAKAMSLTNGDAQAAKARYIALRVEQLISADRTAALQSTQAKRTAALQAKQAKRNAQFNAARDFLAALLLLGSGLLFTLFALLSLFLAVFPIHPAPRWHTESDYEQDKPAPGTRWEDVYNRLDHHMRQDQYEAIRTRYFNDQIRPNIGPEYSIDKTYRAFLERTSARPPADIPVLFRVLFALFLAVLFGVLAYYLFTRPVVKKFLASP
jgi:hypothetical protein